MINQRIFLGKWISDEVFAPLTPRNVFHRQLEEIDLPADPNENAHILFRKDFSLQAKPSSAVIYLSADDYYKLYVNGRFVSQGPAPAYHHCYLYNAINVSAYLREGENVIAVHTYYQGLINRVWQSGDFRHGMILDLEVDGEVLFGSDKSFLTHRHTAYSAMGKVGYDTQFMERYDSRAPEVTFFMPEFDDSHWQPARERAVVDYSLYAQKTAMLTLERIDPVWIKREDNCVTYDFGGIWVGYLVAKARGNAGDVITVYAAQEMEEDGSTIRHKMRCNCDYTEEWILSGGEDTLNQFDYKSFRYAKAVLPEGTELLDVYLLARHYPFRLARGMNHNFASDPTAYAIWKLCVRSQRVGVQETIQDCMDREKGFYLGDGCYTALANYILTKDDSMVRKLIDDAFASSFITDGLVTCMDCSFIQEIAEFPLILADLLLWHYRLSKDRAYLEENYPKICRVLDFYKEHYEQNGLLQNLDRWCVVEWPKNYRDDYDVNIRQGEICREPHISINAYYYRAICALNKMAKALGREPYGDETLLRDRILKAFYDPERHLFRDGIFTDHISLPGNVFAYAFELTQDAEFEENFLALLKEKGEQSTFLFTSFPLLFRWAREGRTDEMKRLILHRDTWSRMLREDATTTFEGWGKDCKWNTSLFHLTMSSVAIFLADINAREIFA